MIARLVRRLRSRAATRGDLARAEPPTDRMLALLETRARLAALPAPLRAAVAWAAWSARANGIRDAVRLAALEVRDATAGAAARLLPHGR